MLPIAPKPILIIVLTMALSLCARSQTEIDKQKWLALFDKPFDSTDFIIPMWMALSPLPQPERQAVIVMLEKEKQAVAAPDDLIKLAILKTKVCSLDGSLWEGKNWRYWGFQALNQSSVKENDYLLQSACLVLGDVYLSFWSYDTAVFYLLKGIELAEKLDYKQAVLANYKVAVSNPLVHTRNYAECIALCTGALTLESSLPQVGIITAYNNTGLSYLRMNKPDSAIWYFSRGIDYTRKVHSGIWEAILSGNVGDALHAKGADAEAMPYWQKDYDSSMQYNDTPNAAITLAYMSQYQFNQGERQKALQQLHWAGFQHRGNPYGISIIDNIKAYCYRKMGLHDSADLFLKRHYEIADSLTAIASRNNLNIVKLRLAYENSDNEYRLLNKAKHTEVVRRNFLLVALATLAIIALLLYNRQRLRIKLSRQQQQLAEAERNSAREQLNIFTRTLLEKNEQIEQLNHSLEQQNKDAGEELRHLTLLTDYDWNRFRELFEKIYPQFFPQLKKAAAGITPAEMRLAALIKLNLDNKQMASMQGISVSSLRGNKTRLRQKLNISAETDLDELIRQL
jgi:DNA-binding CsgD family transcriptional regulator